MKEPSGVPSTTSPSRHRSWRSPALNAAIFLIFSFGVLWAYAFVFADGATDNHYTKLATPRSNRLVLGTSRASQGIDPRILGEGGINFAFTMLNSPYGETYYQAIRKKVGDSGGDGRFIVEVSPLALSNITLRGPSPREERGILERTWFVSGKPNLPYLLRCYGKPLWTLARPASEKFARVRDDGMLVMSLPGTEAEHTARIRNKIEQYSAVFRSATPSDERIGWFRKTLTFLEERGDVTIVRLPMGSWMFRKEREYWPGFSAAMNQEAERHGARFIDFSSLSRDAITTDGNHLNAETAAAISSRIRQAISGAAGPTHSAFQLSANEAPPAPGGAPIFRVPPPSL